MARTRWSRLAAVLGVATVVSVTSPVGMAQSYAAGASEAVQGLEASAESAGALVSPAAKRDVRAWTTDRRPRGGHAAFHHYGDLVYACDDHADGWYAIAYIRVVGDPWGWKVTDWNGAAAGCGVWNADFKEGTRVEIKACLYQDDTAWDWKFCSSYVRAVA